MCHSISPRGLCATRYSGCSSPHGTQAKGMHNSSHCSSPSNRAAAHHAAYAGAAAGCTSDIQPPCQPAAQLSCGLFGSSPRSLHVARAAAARRAASIQNALQPAGRLFRKRRCSSPHSSLESCTAARRTGEKFPAYKAVKGSFKLIAHDGWVEWEHSMKAACAWIETLESRMGWTQGVWKAWIEYIRVTRGGRATREETPAATTRSTKRTHYHHISR